MVVRMLGYKNGVTSKKNSDETYSFVRAYVACEGSSSQVDEGETCETLFFRTNGVQRYHIGGLYSIKSDINFFNGQPQIRVIGLEAIDEESDLLI